MTCGKTASGLVRRLGAEKKIFNQMAWGGRELLGWEGEKSRMLTGILKEKNERSNAGKEENWQ